ncbi:16S rRNA (guanine(527)-N(7))-methyltransferase RsmG [Hoeflea sp. WL0058]|uniref:Ribosomal RNA small subunit methyltransferase G n=1 Tax=Flavimaribacter sediminis TaxID=2865987 RepID=A0AAE2ZPH2_9HYPH|nr:16S rRNA (guanine(527)-N(7))-methyltransferase RsmG [Flavimaribacter sediminis]MBW8638352.1 16S rRNA (guanine(527)-N(7))-methyltransferase RsmG [Flavimaribacter sediminis]
MRDQSDIEKILPVSRETMDRLTEFVALFQKWSTAINLAAPSTLPDIWRRHVADSVQLYALNPGPLKWLDLGSGGGFPGIITAILLREAGGGLIDLVESNHKKAAFLRQALSLTGSPGKVHAVRIEALTGNFSEYDAISARALASLNDLLGHTAPWLTNKTIGWFHKGRDYRREIDEARRSWTFDLVEHQSQIDADSVILQVSNVRPIKL